MSDPTYYVNHIRRMYNPVHTLCMNVMFLHFFLFTCVTCVRINDDDDDDNYSNKT